MFTENEKKIIALLQGDIPVTKQPYLDIAKKIGVDEETVLATVKNFCENGVIRRFGATLRHQKSGFNANAMIAWDVDEGRADEVGKIMAEFKQVSHCYRRNPTKSWPYNLYTMVHAPDEATCREIAGNISKKTAIDTYEILFSRKELKKTSMKYFNDELDF